MPSGRRKFDDEDEDMDDTPVEAKRKRQDRPSTDIEERLENLIMKVSEKSSSSLESNLEGLASVLEADFESYKLKILKILLECVVSLPEKLTIYSTLVGLLNAKNYSFGGEFVELLMKTLLEKLQKNEYDEALVIVVFLCDLVNCRVVSYYTCLNLLESFLGITVESNVPQVRCDFYVYTILHSLPWVGKELSEKKNSTLEQLLEGIGNYMRLLILCIVKSTLKKFTPLYSKRQKLHVPMLRVWSSNQPHPQEEYLDCLWAQVTKLKSENWQERHISRHYLAFDAVLCDSLQHNLPNFIPPAHDETKVYPLPKVIFRLFDYTDCPEEGPVLPGAHSVERFLIERDLEWILVQHCFERKACAAALLSYSKRSKIPLNYMILEVIFGQLYLLPKPHYLELFFGSLLIELCKLQPNSMPQVLAQAAEMLYQRIDSMQVSCVDRFVNWFSYHLSNFQFRWSWDDWSECLTLEKFSPKRVFVEEVLYKCMRLSYHQRVVDIIPASFAKLIPQKPQPNFRFSREDPPEEDKFETDLAHELAHAIRNKCTAEELLQTLQNYSISKDLEESEKDTLKLEILTLTLLNLGSKSFSHSFAALAKYVSVLKFYTEKSESLQVTCLNAIYELWSTHQQMIVVLVDKLLKMQIVECASVVNWVFSDTMKENLPKMFVWEIVLSALSKLSNHMKKLQSDVEKKQQEETTKKIEKKQSGSVSDEENKEVSMEENVVEDLAVKLEGAESVQRALFLSLFQRFLVVLSEHLISSETEGRDFNTCWYRAISGRLRHIFLAQHQEAAKYANVLESYLFTSDSDPHILEVFHQFCALRR